MANVTKTLNISQPRMLSGKLTMLLLIMLTNCVFSQQTEAKYAAGTGEPNNPYQIATAEDLILLGDSPEDYDKHFILTADIDLDPNLTGGRVFERAVIAWRTNSEDWSDGTPFTGTLDGNDFSIRNLTISGGRLYLGLFGYLGENAIVMNLILENVSIESGRPFRFVGGVVAYNENASVINCHSTGSVSGSFIGDSTGGIVGHNDGGNVLNCSNAATVRGKEGVGGLVGVNRRFGAHSSGCVLNCNNTGAVSGSSAIGGVVGENHGNLVSCYNTGVVSGTASMVGGLIGDNPTGSVVNCYSMGSVNGGQNVGGLVGDTRDGSVANCYSAGAVSGRFHVGGLVGDNFTGSVANSFWDIETSGQQTSSGGISLTTAEMQNINTYLDSGWDFIGESGNGTCDFWQSVAGSYPELVAFTGHTPSMPDGQGTMESPYIINNAQDIGNVWLRPLANYRLATDIDLTDISWTTAVVPWFRGTFDGNGFCIRYLHIQGARYLGLFGVIADGASIANVGLVETSIEGTDEYIGGLIGTGINCSVNNCYATGNVTGKNRVGGLLGNNNDCWVANCHFGGTVSGETLYTGGLVGHNSAGHVANCSSTGTVTGNINVGGLVGFNHEDSVVLGCYSSATINGSSNVGGLTGDNWFGSIANCYSTGNVTGKRSVGGLMGGNLKGSVANCYSTGVVTGESSVSGLIAGIDGYVTNCFWDIETSGQQTSDGGFGLTTAEMQNINTYLDAGWDILGESGNGTCDFWQFVTGSYPELIAFTGHSPSIPEGQGTRESPYMIDNAQDLGHVWLQPLANYRLDADIDLTDISWTTAVIPWFGGTFHGNGHTINNLRVKGAGHLGLFGMLKRKALIMNLGMEKVSIEGAGNAIGGLVGYNNFGSMSNCYSIGTVSGNAKVGGLIGINNLGSLPYFYSRVAYCYAAGTVNGGEILGGLVGHGWPVAVINCFWDSETSGLTTSDGGTSKTTAEMQTASTFLEAGWDFVDEITNGTEDIWWILEGQDYPRHSWEAHD